MIAIDDLILSHPHLILPTSFVESYTYVLNDDGKSNAIDASKKMIMLVSHTPHQTLICNQDHSLKS